MVFGPWAVECGGGTTIGYSNFLPFRLCGDFGLLPRGCGSCVVVDVVVIDCRCIHENLLEPVDFMDMVDFLEMTLSLEATLLMLLILLPLFVLCPLLVLRPLLTLRESDDRRDRLDGELDDRRDRLELYDRSD